MPALIVNPRSSGGKAARFDLIAQCAKRGIEPIIFEPGDDLAALAATATRPRGVVDSEVPGRFGDKRRGRD